MAKQEDLGYKLYKKIQFPQNDFNYLYENFEKFLVVSATDGNKLYSKPAAVNEGNDEVQERVTDMILNPFHQQEAPEVHFSKCSGDPLKCQYLSKAFKKRKVERKIRDPFGNLKQLIKFTDGGSKDLIKHCIHLKPEIGYNTAITLLNKKYDNPRSLLTSYRTGIKSLNLNH